MANQPAIYGKILEVQQEIKGLEKNGVGPATQGGYKFLAVDDVLKVVKPLLDKVGVIVVPTLLDHGFDFTKAADKGDGRTPKVATSAWVKYEFRFVAVEDGSSVSSVVIGEGADQGDKSVRKSTTSAWKIALIQTFALITGEVDPDAQDGANTSGSDSTPKQTPAARKIEQARGGSAVDQLKDAIRKEFIEAEGSVFTTSDLNDLVKKIKAEDKFSSASQEKLLTEVQKRLRAGEVA